MSRSPWDVRVRFSAHRRVPRPARRQGLRPSASLHPSAVTHRRSRLAFAGIGLAAGAGLAGTVAVSAPAAGFGAVNHRTILHPAAAPPVATTTRREPYPAGVAPVCASRTQGRQPLTRQVTRLVSRAIPVAPPFSGDASWYGPGFEGHSTANGDRYDSSLLTAASKTLPLGTRLQVCHIGACVTGLVNDRGPYVGDRVLDLSRAAAADIRLVDAGVGYVTATPIETRQVTETVTETRRCRPPLPGADATGAHCARLPGRAKFGVRPRPAPRSSGALDAQVGSGNQMEEDPMSEPLQVQRHDDGVVVLTLDQPDRRNAMTESLTHAWSEQMSALAQDLAVRAVVVTGAGSAFCAGGDLSWITADAPENVTPDRLRAKMYPFYRAWLALRDLPVPSIAAVNGPAVGAGLCLALACDLRYAGPRARFSAPFTSLGMHPGMAATWLLPEAVGMPRAREMFFAGRVVHAEEAVSWGLASALVPDVVTHAVDIAHQIAATAPIAVRLTKAALAHPYRGYAEALEWEAAAQPITMATADLREGIAAAGERRAPRFTGA